MACFNVAKYFVYLLLKLNLKLNHYVFLGSNCLISTHLADYLKFKYGILTNNSVVIIQIYLDILHKTW